MASYELDILKDGTSAGIHVEDEVLEVTDATSLKQFLIEFRVEGDHVIEEYTNHHVILAPSLESAVEQVWPFYKKAIHHMYKKLEVAILMEPRPNPAFSVVCLCNGEFIDEEKVLKALFSHRLLKTEKDKPAWE